MSVTQTSHTVTSCEWSTTALLMVRYMPDCYPWQLLVRITVYTVSWCCIGETATMISTSTSTSTTQSSVFNETTQSSVFNETCGGDSQTGANSSSPLLTILIPLSVTLLIVIFIVCLVVLYRWVALELCAMNPLHPVLLPLLLSDKSYS